MALEQAFPSSTSISPVSTIPPLLHTHSSIYHPRCIMFFSQHFSFPCQYHSTIAPFSTIHLLPTLYNFFLPVLQFPLSVPFHHCSTLISICMLLLPYGQKGEAWEPPQKLCFFENRGALDGKELPLNLFRLENVKCRLSERQDWQIVQFVAPDVSPALRPFPYKPEIA